PLSLQRRLTLNLRQLLLVELAHRRVGGVGVAEAVRISQEVKRALRARLRLIEAGRMLLELLNLRELLRIQIRHAQQWRVAVERRDRRQGAFRGGPISRRVLKSSARPRRQPAEAA